MDARNLSALDNNSALTTQQKHILLLQYFKISYVLVAAMAPICGPYGPMSHLTWHLTPETMAQRLKEARPITWFCCNVELGRSGIWAKSENVNVEQLRFWHKVKR